MKRLIIDASVVLKWYLADEEDGGQALSLLEKYVAGKLNLMAPFLLEYEVANGLNIAKKKGRIDEKEVIKALDGFVNLDIELRPLSSTYAKALHYCNLYNITAYDASYVALAENERVPLVTADKKLYNSLKKITWVNWLGDVKV